MSKAAKPSPSGSVSPGDLPFEEALNRLESIVEAMESEELPLETMLARYEEGMKLAETCQARLRAAEVRISQLEKNAAGEPVLKPLSAAETGPNDAS